LRYDSQVPRARGKHLLPRVVVAGLKLLKSLELPSISHIEGQLVASFAPLPHLPRLRRFACQYYAIPEGDLAERLVEFVDNHPTLSEVSWGGQLPKDPERVPFLPNLRRIYDSRSAYFAHIYLRGKSPGSVKLEVFACYSSDLHPPELLRALDPTCLRVLRVHNLNSDGIGGVRQLARMFPAIEELELPSQGSWNMRDTDTHALQRAGRTVLRALGRPVPEARGWPRLASIHDVVPLFPHLRTVGSVDVGGDFMARSMAWSQRPNLTSYPVAIDRRAFSAVSATLAALHKRYPRLQSVNGWRIEGQGQERARVVLVHRVTGHSTRTCPVEARFELTRDGYAVGYVGMSS